MALSLKNTVISLSLSGLMVFAAYITGNAPLAPAKSATSPATSAVVAQDNAERGKSLKKAKRVFTTPYFSFGKSNLPAGVR
jgi:hypothetical protein